MKKQCIDAAQQAIGRSLTVAEIKGIEARISKNMRTAARADPAAFQSLSAVQRMQEAGKLAAQELVHEAQLAKVRTALTIIAHDRLESFSAAHPAGRMSALDRTLAARLDGKDGTISVESRANAIRNIAMGEFSQALEQLGPKWLGLTKNAEGAKALFQELRGKDSGVPEAKAAAKVFSDISERLRKQFNAAGGNVGKLDDWAHPQQHSQYLVAKVGKQAWVDTVLPKLDRQKYLREDGSLMKDGEVADFLGNAWDTIATGGLNKLTPGQFAGGGMRANRGSESRQIHFADADGYLEYHARFGDKNLMGTLVGHIDGIAKDIALVETFGPHPNLAFRLFKDKAMKEGVLAKPTDAGKLVKQGASLDTLYAHVSGNTPPIADAALARRFDAVRNWLVSTRLGSAVITSFADEATMHLTAHVNNLPESRLLLNELATMNPKNVGDRRLLRRAGLGLETLTNAFNRAGQEYLVNGVTQRVATFTMRASGLNYVTDARKQAFGATMMDALGHLTRKSDFAKLDPSDNRILLSKGITATDWGVWKTAKLEDWNGRGDLLTPASIMQIPDSAIMQAGLATDASSAGKVRQEAAIKLLAAVQEEVDVAVITPGAREGAMMHGNMQRGTWKGELARSFFLFKSFPITMINRHWHRALGMETKGGTAAYSAALIAGTTVMGALSVQVGELLAGRDPQNMNPLEGDKGGRFWVQALLKGGSLGLYGDFLYSQQSKHGQGSLASMLGPVAGLAEQAINLTQGNLVQLAMGEDTKAGAEFVRMLRGLTPGANLWYAKAGLDHMIFHQLQEYFSPGYLATMEARARREFGQTYWWQPGGDLADARQPNLEKAMGQ